MKYIRTKTGIKTQYDTVRPCNVVKKADTIEELCDEFIRVNEDFHDFLVSDDIPTQIKGWDIYGAIWTNKGLIYVAKMNKKGELELL